MTNKLKTLIVAAGLAVAAVGTTAATAAPAEAKGAIVIKYKGKYGYYKGHYGHRHYRRRCKPVYRYYRRYGHVYKKFVGWRCYPRYRYHRY